MRAWDNSVPAKDAVVRTMGVPATDGMYIRLW